MFHLHKWEEVRRTSHPPRRGTVEASRATESFMRMIVFGYTEIELKCKHCGDIKFVNSTKLEG